MNNTPPILPEKLLIRFLKEELAEEVLGDLEEKFILTTQQRSAFRAKLNYWYQVLHYIRPFAIRSIFNNSIFNNMYLHSLKIGLRSIRKSRGYSALNIVGLTIGMSVAMLIGLWIHDEITFNQSFEHYDRIAKVMVHHINPQQENNTGSVMPPGLGTHLRENFENQFEKVAIARSRPEDIILGNETDQFTTSGLFIQQDGPSIFSLDMIEGELNGLSDKSSIMISESLANRLFGAESAYGQIVKYNGQKEMTVTGVYHDFPSNTALAGTEYMAPFELYIEGWSDVTVWDNYFTEIFVQLDQHADVATTSELIEELLLPHLEGSGQRLLFVEPMANWHLFSAFEDGVRVTSQRIKFVWIFGLVGVFVLALACINFTNLSTARSEKRAKEIGVRKSIGSVKGQLVSQFLIEALLISGISLFISWLVIYLSMPFFNHISGKDISIPFDNLYFWALSIGVAVVTGLMAGSYPAFYLSAISPIRSLKGTYKAGKLATLPRKLLVIFQFSISIILIVGTLIIYNQINHVKSRPVGYDQDNLLMLTKRTGDMYGKYDVFKNEFEKSGAVTAVGEANYPLDNTLGNNDGFGWEGKDPEYNPAFNTIKVNYDYGNAIGWEIIEGRDFSREFPGDVRNAVVITESAKEAIGLDDPVGQVLTFNNDWYSESQVTIVGVVKDMIKGNPFEEAKPAIMFLSEDRLYWMFLRLNDQLSASEAISRVERVIREVAPNAPFDYNFVDDAYDVKFRSEERIGQLITFFAVLAILISCLGLFGLASYVADRKTKEIGIRKTLGASVLQLWQKLSVEFVMLVVISTAIATPVAYYLLEQWLDSFQYRIEMNLLPFIIAGILALLVTLLTVSYQTLRAAMINPVKSLRSE